MQGSGAKITKVFDITNLYTNKKDEKPTLSFSSFFSLAILTCQKYYSLTTKIRVICYTQITLIFVIFYVTFLPKK